MNPGKDKVFNRKINDNPHLSWLFQQLGQQFLAMDEAVGEEELKSKNIKGLIAEFDTMDTPMIAWGGGEDISKLKIVFLTSTAPHQDMVHQESARISCLMNSSTM